MDTQPLADLQTLSSTDKTILKRSEITCVRELLLLSASDLSKRCNIVYKDAQSLIDTVCEELAPELRLYTLDDPEMPHDLTFTTGDQLLDKCLGGGIMTGRIWEIVGESGAGKSQLCMQMLYTVQLPRSRGGIAGASCLLTTTSSDRRSKRLNEILSEHPSLSASQCSTGDIHFIKAFTVSEMMDVLSKDLPELVSSCAEQPFSKPIKLLVIDALTELFREHETTDHIYLKQRSSTLTEISKSLYRLAHDYNIAVVVVNEVRAAMNEMIAGARTHEVLYQNQLEFFGLAEPIIGKDDRQKAALGFAWANCVNARMMLSKTTRACYPEQRDSPTKRRRLNNGKAESQQPITIRKLTVIFNTLTPSTSLHYVVTAGGVMALPPENVSMVTVEAAESPPNSLRQTARPTTMSMHIAEISSLDLPFADVTESETDMFSELPSSSAELGSQPTLVADSAEDGPQGGDDEDYFWKVVDDRYGNDFEYYTQ